MTIKDQLLQEIESTPDTLLAETLNFLRFLKTKQYIEKPEAPESTAPSNSETDLTKNLQQSYRPASGHSILRHTGKWAGDDFEECLQQVYATRGKAKFEYDLNPFE